LTLIVVDQTAIKVVVERGASQGSFQYSIVLKISDLIFSILKVGFDIGKIVSKALGVVGHSSNWIVTVDIVWVDLAAHLMVLVIDIYSDPEIAK
jgi:hypothetical protein